MQDTGSCKILTVNDVDERPGPSNAHHDPSYPLLFLGTSMGRLLICSLPRKASAKNHRVFRLNSKNGLHCTWTTCYIISRRLKSDHLSRLERAWHQHHPQISGTLHHPIQTALHFGHAFSRQHHPTPCLHRGSCNSILKETQQYPRKKKKKKHKASSNLKCEAWLNVSCQMIAKCRDPICLYTHYGSGLHVQV